MNLNDFFTENPRLAIAFSGGVDSAYLLYEALNYCEQVRAYYFHSPFQPQFERDDAERLATELHADLRILPIDVLSDPAVAENPTDRCYHCKKRIFTEIINAAREDGFTVLADGTNATDDEEDRPGMRALAELSVRSPLRECGLTKREIRKNSRAAGLFTWDKPTYACLATRIPAGEPITTEKLRITEAAEAYLTSAGFCDFRIRMCGDAARIQMSENQIPRLMLRREEIVSALKKYYPVVLLDLEARNVQ